MICDMHEVQTFLRQAWAEAENARLAQKEAVENARIAKDVDDLQQKIASENDAIAKEWKRVGLAVAAEVGLIIVASSSNSLLNSLSSSGGIIGMLAGLVGLVFALGFWIGLLIVAGMVFIALFNTIIRLPSIAKLNAEIRYLQASRPI